MMMRLMLTRNMNFRNICILWMLFLGLIETTTSFIIQPSHSSRLLSSSTIINTNQQNKLHYRINPSLQMTDNVNNTPEPSNNNKLPFWLDPNTKGGVIVLMFALFGVPVLAYNVLIAFGMDDIEAGIDIGIGFTIVTCFAWVSTYVFRVATKDMTYVSFFLLHQFVYLFLHIIVSLFIYIYITYSDP